jgi:antitoxin component YwqK of YwqJK toxin-antitoxin module
MIFINRNYFYYNNKMFNFLTTGFKWAVFLSGIGLMMWYKKINQFLKTKNKIKAYIVSFPYIITVETEAGDLINIYEPLVDANYALYISSSDEFLTKKIYDVKNKKKVKKILHTSFENTEEVIQGKPFLNYANVLFKTLKAAKTHLNLKIPPFNGWKKHYDFNGGLMFRRLYKYNGHTHNLIIKELYNIYPNFVLVHNFLRNYTLLRNAKREVVFKCNGIVYFFENLITIESIENYVNRRLNGFEKHYNENGGLTSLNYYKNDKFNGKRFDSTEFRFIQNGQSIFYNVISIFHHYSCFINIKRKIKVI